MTTKVHQIKPKDSKNKEEKFIETGKNKIQTPQRKERRTIIRFSYKQIMLCEKHKSNFFVQVHNVYLIQNTYQDAVLERCVDFSKKW